MSKESQSNHFYRYATPYRGKSRRIGLLGGSFNPPHQGHLQIAQRAKRVLKLTEVWWLISPQNPLKSARGLAPMVQRQQWCQQIFGTDRQMKALGIEAYLGTSYSAETVRKLQKRYPVDQFVWIIGADNFIQLPKWYQWQNLIRQIPICVIDRQGYGLAALCSEAAGKMAKYRVPISQLWHHPPPAWCFESYKPVGHSSTEIRQNGWFY